ncbi:MAG: SMP-30/gluconolactonase/LRE family protein [Betaproteobacteria bacterium]|jgi:sugar lactone lactonase YvrE
MSHEIQWIKGYRAIIGEAPLWSSSEQALYWIDTVGKKILRYFPKQNLMQMHDLPRRPSALCLAQGGRLLVAFKQGLAFYDFELNQLEWFEHLGIDFSQALFNDGACDAMGRLWIGTMDRQLTNPIGQLYCIQADSPAQSMQVGFTVSNGICWSPDGLTMYQVDSRPGLIYSYAFDCALGLVSNPRLFLDYRGRGCRPDGCTTDSLGNLWVAELEGGCVSAYDEWGTKIKTVNLPVKKPTSVCFGGEDLSMLFVTSMSYGQSSVEGSDTNEFAGQLMVLDVGVCGKTKPIFTL